MNTQECQTDSPEITLGDKFRIAREALHLSLEEVADAIALRPSILKSLEGSRSGDIHARLCAKLC